LKAAEVILDRGWGKAPQHIGGVEGGEPIQVYLKNFILPEEDGGEAVETSDPPVRIR
jgi:hypothetical protein